MPGHRLILRPISKPGGALPARYTHFCICACPCSACCGCCSLGKACSSFQKCHFRQFFSLKFLLKGAIFRHFSPTTKRHLSLNFAPRKKVPFFAKKIAKNVLDPTHSPKLDHFSPHFAPRRVHFSPFFASREKCHFRRNLLREKKYHFWRKISRKTGSTQLALCFGESINLT